MFYYYIFEKDGLIGLHALEIKDNKQTNTSEFYINGRGQSCLILILLE